MGDVTLKGWLIVPSERLAAVRAGLPDHIRLTRAEPGCLSFNVTEESEREGYFRVEERFSSKDAFEAHQSRAAQSAWAEITKDLERDYQITGLSE